MGMLLFAQADIAPLMASLIGVPFPLNSVVRNKNICLQQKCAEHISVLGMCWDQDLKHVRGKVLDLEKCYGDCL